MKNTITETLGWYGTLAIIVAYILVSFDYLSSGNIWFQILNGTGAVGIIIVSLHKRVYQPAVLNTIWAVIALVAIVKVLFY